MLGLTLDWRLYRSCDYGLELIMHFDTVANLQV